ncbi:MAG: 6-bladed beta-propeller [Gemmatimonadaceae bacterium]|nr:6-bladed beta-propeller [Gemmatimonadaceae bacterium]
MGSIARGLLALAALAPAALAAQSRFEFPRLGAVKLELGEESEPAPDLFSTIRAVAFDRVGRIYVLDTGDHSVRMFASNGKFIGRAGRAGRGPADFAYPHTMLHDGDSTLFVVDEINGIAEFRTDASGLHYVRSVGADLFPRSTCTLGTRFVVGGYKDDKMVHIVDRDAIAQASFGEGFNRDTSEAVRTRANRQAVSVRCDERNGRIVLAECCGAGIRSYSASGELLWSARLPDYQGVRYSGNAKSVSEFWGSDFTESIHLMSDTVALVQVKRIKRLPGGVGRGRRAAIETVSVTSHAIDLRSGRVMATTKALPLMMAIGGGVAAVVSEDPYPRIEVRALVRR